MLISTKGRYALRTMTDLAEHGKEGPVSLASIASRQEISLKYLERIMPLLTRAGLVVGASGKGGGYRLTRKPSEYSAGEILRVTEGTLAPVACLECESNTCPRHERCRTLLVWTKLEERMNEYLNGVNLEDIISGQI